MAAKFQVGDCVRLPDGRIGRVRARVGRQLRIRVRRRTSGRRWQSSGPACVRAGQADCAHRSQHGEGAP